MAFANHTVAGIKELERSFMKKYIYKEIVMVLLLFSYWLAQKSPANSVGDTHPEPHHLASGSGFLYTKFW